MSKLSALGLFIVGVILMVGPKAFSQTIPLRPGVPLNATESPGTDIDGDGFEELILGFPFYDENDPQTGEVRIIPTANVDDTLYLYGTQGNDGFGYRAFGVSDLSGDGIQDILVSAPYFRGGGTRCLDKFTFTLMSHCFTRSRDFRTAVVLELRQQMQVT